MRTLLNTHTVCLLILRLSSILHSLAVAFRFQFCREGCNCMFQFESIYQLTNSPRVEVRMIFIHVHRDLMPRVRKAAVHLARHSSSHFLICWENLRTSHNLRPSVEYYVAGEIFWSFYISFRTCCPCLHSLANIPIFIRTSSAETSHLLNDCLTRQFAASLLN